jgi:hypothetical protein
LSVGTEKDDLFSSMPERKAVVTLAIPTVISQIIIVIYNMADTFFVGQLDDPNQVAAATFAMPLFMFMTAIANLFGIGGASLISRCLGANKREKASHCSSFCVWTAVAAAFFYGITIIECWRWDFRVSSYPCWLPYRIPSSIRSSLIAQTKPSPAWESQRKSIFWRLPSHRA